MALLAACPSAPARPPLDPAAYPGVLRDPAGLAGEFLLRQRIEASFATGTAGFEAVLQKRGDTLLLLGLTPLGTKAFVVTQRGAEVAVETFAGVELPFPPRFMMLDVHRAHFAPPGLGEPPADGDRSVVWEGEEIVEQWRGGQLVERRFRRLDGQPPGAITVRYGVWEPGQPSASRLEIDQAWFGYVLRIQTLEQQRL